MSGMAAFGILIFLIPTIIIVTIVAFLIYKAIYDKHTNKVLESGETQKRKWLAPWALALIVLGAQLLIVAGIMYPISMYMAQPKVVYETFDPYGDIPVEDRAYIVDISDSVKYVVDDKDYVSEGVLENENLSVECYSRKNDDGSINYIYIGTIDKIDGGPVRVDTDLTGENNKTYSSATLVELSPKATVAYFKVEIRLEAGHKSDFHIGVKYGTHAYSDDFVQEINIKLDS